MLELPTALPPGALCDSAGQILAEALAGSGGYWWTGPDLLADAKTGAVTAWPSRLGDRRALPTGPAEGNGLIGEAGDLVGLQCRDGVHCGMVAETVAAEAATVTLGLRYLPPYDGDARTLLTFNTGGVARKTASENYLFVSEAEGALVVKDDAGLVELDLPAPPGDAPRTVLVSLAEDRLSVSILGGRTGAATARAPVLSGPANLFIGCRNQRSGLLKTLGGALICDVWLWPGRALLMARAQADRSALIAMRRFHLWAEAG